jgi:amino acid adenylation domain-containing protein
LLSIIDFCFGKEEIEMTPSDYWPGIVTVAQLEEIKKNLANAEIEKIYPLSPMQAGMLFHYRADRESTVYFQQYLFEVRGGLDIASVRESVRRLVGRYDALRTVFLYQQLEQPVQVVLKERDIDVYFEDISGLEEEEKDAYVLSFAERDREKGFGLTGDVPLRVSVLRTRQEEDVFNVLWSYHHIVMDGWCQDILFRDFFDFYESSLHHLPVQKQEAEPYFEYIHWLESRDADGAMSFWRDYLAEYDRRAVLPVLGSTAANKAAAVDRFSFALEPGLTARLEQLARDCGVTLHGVFLCLWGILLARYNNTDDVVFGNVVSGRPPELEGVDAMVGLFINTVPVRIRIPGSMAFGQLLERVREESLETQSYSYLPLADIQGETELNRDLLDHIMVFENYPLQEELKTLEMEQRLGFSIKHTYTFEQTNYDFTLMVLPGERLAIEFLYNSHIYEVEILNTIKTHLLNLLQRVLENPDQDVVVLDIMAPGERRRILEEFNDTAAEYPAGKTLQGWFESQVRRMPDRTAVTGLEPGENRTYWTYKELNRGADGIADALRQKGAGPGGIVGIKMNRSPGVVAAVLGILKTGCGYLPLDPSLPGERIDYMLRDSGAGLLMDGGISRCSSSGALTAPEGLAYVIYTSGSTGRPKGVMLEQRNGVNLIYWGIHHTNLDFSRMAQYHSLSFDLSFQEIFSALLSGGGLHIIEDKIKTDIPAIFKRVETRDIRTIFLPMSLLRVIFSEESYAVAVPGCLRHIQTAGEQLVISERFRRYLKENHVYLHNHYGPSETHVVTALTIDPEGEIPELPSIGRPISNTQIYILDQQLRPQPVGVPGELHVSGHQVGRGYINDPRLTYKRFLEVQEPFSSKKVPGRRRQRLYGTGDLARWLPGGGIEFLGRVDFQVKVRGFRVEPGEVESRLLDHGSISEAVVTVWEPEPGNRRLCAYIVPLKGEDVLPDQETLRAYLSGVLPDYMAPSYFMVVDALPLTVSGKIDRRALPVPGVEGAKAMEVPVDEVETKLLELWSGVLHTDCGVTDHFFDKGGHSLTAARLTARIHKALHVRVGIAQLFQFPSVREMAGYIRGLTKDSFMPVEPAALRDYYPLSSAQERLYFLHRVKPGNTAYNMPELFRVRGELDVVRLEQAFNGLIRRHESLRSSFHMVDSEPVQVVHGEIGPIGPIGPIFPEEPFDLSVAPLFKVGLELIDEGCYDLKIDMHHIISDGVSMELLMEEFAALYGGRELEPLRLQYKDYAVWQLRRRRSGAVKEQEDYWFKEFSGELPVLDIPTDFPRPAVQGFEGDAVHFDIGPGDTALLKNMAREHGATLFMVLLAVYSVYLAKVTGKDDIVTGLPVAGRGHGDLNRIIGLFVNTVAVRTRPGGERGFDGFLESVKRKTLEAFENQDCQFDVLVQKTSGQRDFSRNPLIQTGLVYRGKGKPGPRLEGLTLTPLPLETQASKLDLEFYAEESGEDIRCSFVFSTALFKKETIRLMVERFLVLMRNILANRGAKIEELRYETEMEKEMKEVDGVEFDF